MPWRRLPTPGAETFCSNWRSSRITTTGQAGREAQRLETAVDILTTAMEAERAAQARYEAWAARATLPSVQCLFRRLAHEESVHERILNDEFYSLSNRGIWLWGD